MENLELVREIQARMKSSDEEISKDLLQQLKGLQMTFEILKETKIAKTIKRLEKKYSVLKYIVRDLIDRWRGIVKLKKKTEEKPIHLEDSRNKVIKILTEALNDREKAIEIESELHKAEPSNYASKARSLKFNLSKNEELKKCVLDGSILPEELVKMNPKDMVSDERKQERIKIEKDLTDSRRSDWHAVNNAPKAGMFKCRRCGSDKTMTHQMQTRSADEPMTT